MPEEPAATAPAGLDLLNPNEHDTLQERIRTWINPRAAKLLDRESYAASFFRDTTSKLGLVIGMIVGMIVCVSAVVYMGTREKDPLPPMLEDVSKVTVIRKWPEHPLIDLSAQDIDDGLLPAGFRGTIANLVKRNVQMLYENNEVCMHPNIYTAPINILSLRPRGERYEYNDAEAVTVLNPRIVRFGGEKTLSRIEPLWSQTDAETATAEARWRILYSEIELEHHTGRLNVTNTAVSQCIGVLLYR